MQNQIEESRSKAITMNIRKEWLRHTKICLKLLRQHRHKLPPQIRRHVVNEAVSALLAAQSLQHIEKTPSAI